MAAAEDAAGCATPSGCSLPLGLPDRVHRPGRRPAARPRRPLRPHPRSVPRPAGRRRPRRRPGPGARGCSSGSRPTAGSCGASSGPTASSASGATTTCCASCGGGRWPRCAGRSSRSTPRRWPASCPRGRASAAAAGLDGLVEVLAVLQGAPIVGVGARGRRAAGPPARLPPGRPRRALHLRRGGVGRGRRARRDRRSGPPRSSATRSACCCPIDDERRSRSRARCTPPCASTSPPGARRSGPTSCGRPPRPAGAYDDDACSTRSGISCGRAWSPTTRFAPLRARIARQGPQGAAAAGPRPPTCHRLGSRLGPPAGAGRWSLVAPLRASPVPTAHRGRPRPGRCSCSSATACSPARRRWARAPRAASPASTRCSRRSRSGARCGAATSWPGSAPPSSRCPARSTGCARPAR